MSRRPTIVHTRDSILTRLAEGPVSRVDLAQTRKVETQRYKTAAAIINALVEEGAIKRVFIGKYGFYALSAWKASAEVVQGYFDERSRENADGCIEWLGYCDPYKGPMAPMGANGPQTQPEAVRRVLWKLHTGKQLGFSDSIVPGGCENERCINFEHLVKKKRGHSQVGTFATPLARLRMSQSKRLKVSEETIAEIKSSSLSCRDEAKKHGISPAYVSGIRRGTKAVRPETGMFSGLIAANDAKTRRRA